MVAVQVRDVPESVRKTLMEEARRRGTSLQAYLLDVLEGEAASAGNRAHATVWRANPLVDTDAELDVVAALAVGRDLRDAAIYKATAACPSL